MIAATMLGLALSLGSPACDPPAGSERFTVWYLHDGAPVDQGPLMADVDAYVRWRTGRWFRFERGERCAPVVHVLEFEGVSGGDVADSFDRRDWLDAISAAGGGNGPMLVLADAAGCGMTTGSWSFVGTACRRPGVVHHELGHAIQVNETEQEAGVWPEEVVGSTPFLWPERWRPSWWSDWRMK